MAAAAAAAMEWSSESAAVRRHRGAAERREGPAAAPHREREASAQEDASGSGRTRRGSSESGGASRGAGTALSEARTVLALALYLLALRALVQLSLQRLVLSRTSGLQGEFDARQARYGGPARPHVRCCSGRESPGVGELRVGERRAGEPRGQRSLGRVSLAPRCRVPGGGGPWAHVGGKWDGPARPSGVGIAGIRGLQAPLSFSRGGQVDRICCTIHSAPPAEGLLLARPCEWDVCAKIAFIIKPFGDGVGTTAPPNPKAVNTPQRAPIQNFAYNFSGSPLACGSSVIRIV